MSEHAAAGGTVREAVLGELVHDRGSAPDEGWFIVGVNGYFDVDNACWCRNEPGDAPWTLEYFHLLGTIVDLIAEGPGLAVKYALAMDGRES